MRIEQQKNLLTVKSPQVNLLRKMKTYSLKKILRVKILSLFFCVMEDGDFPGFLLQHPPYLTQVITSQKQLTKPAKMYLSKLVHIMKNLQTRGHLSAKDTTQRNIVIIGIMVECVRTKTVDFFMRNLQFVNLMADVPEISVCFHMLHRTRVFYPRDEHPELHGPVSNHHLCGLRLHGQHHSTGVLQLQHHGHNGGIPGRSLGYSRAWETSGTVETKEKIQ